MIPESEYGKMEFNPVVKKSLTATYPKIKQIVGEANDKMLRYVKIGRAHV